MQYICYIRYITVRESSKTYPHYPQPVYNSYPQVKCPTIFAFPFIPFLIIHRSYTSYPHFYIFTFLHSHFTISTFHDPSALSLSFILLHSSFTHSLSFPSIRSLFSSTLSLSFTIHSLLILLTFNPGHLFFSFPFIPFLIHHSYILIFTIP